MKKLFAIVGIAFTSCISQAEWVKVTYHVMDEERNPITNAVINTSTERDRVNLSWLKPIPMRTCKAKSNKEGTAVERFICHSGDFNIDVSADGFYPERFRQQQFKTEMNSRGTDYIFLEREKDMSIILRRVKHPCHMVSHKYTDRDFPRRNGKFGFDLEKNDWTAPYGKGVVADITISYNLTVTNNAEHCTGALRFGSGGGAYKMKKHNSTSFVSVYEANTNETFVSEFPFSSFCSLNSDDYWSVRVAEDDEYLVFRTRVVKDADGKIISANYGKIYGMIRTIGIFSTGQTFFNPTPNDTNLEAKK